MEALIHFHNHVALARFRHRHEAYAAAGLQHAPHLAEHERDVGRVDQIEREGGEDRIE
jgi:hypothetical protein